jgi:prevent-host-death family protein
MTTVGAFEAKTHLPKLLARVENGESIIITRHGKEVARLIPPPGNVAKADAVQAVAEWRRVRKDVRLGGLSVRKLIEEGRA